MNFLPDDEGYKFVDDSTFLEVLNLIAIGLSSYNAKFHVPSDIPPDTKYLPPENFKTQSHLDQINKWTEEHQMLLNPTKSKYMIINFCNSYQFRTRLSIQNSLIEQVHETKLLGVLIQDNLHWHANTKNLVKKAFSRMIILRKLTEFAVPQNDMLTIYVLFIRSVVEQSSVVWSSSLTREEEISLERTQKVALRIIYQNQYISYENALQKSKLPTIKQRYETLLYRFAKKCSQNPKTKDMLPLAKFHDWARKNEKYEVPMARKQRFYQSAIPTMARMLNKEH